MLTSGPQSHLGPSFLNPSKRSRNRNPNQIGIQDQLTQLPLRCMKEERGYGEEFCCLDVDRLQNRAKSLLPSTLPSRRFASFELFDFTSASPIVSRSRLRFTLI